MALEHNRMKHLRITKGVYQKNLAKLLKVTERHYRLCEAGGVDLPTSKLIALSDYFGVSLDYLVGRTDNPSVNK